MQFTKYKDTELDKQWNYGENAQSIGSLIFLESLGIFQNDVEGNIPSDIGELINLRELANLEILQNWKALVN